MLTLNLEVLYFFKLSPIFVGPTNVNLQNTEISLNTIQLFLIKSSQVRNSITQQTLTEDIHINSTQTTTKSPPTTSTTTTTTTTTKTTTTTTTSTTTAAPELSCGIQDLRIDSTRIVNGEEADPGAWPWAAVIGDLNLAYSFHYNPLLINDLLLEYKMRFLLVKAYFTN